MDNEKQDAVKEEAVEKTIETESAPVEEPTEVKTEDTQPTPADATIEPEKKVSEDVPRTRLNEEIAKKNTLKQEVDDLRTALGKAVQTTQPDMTNEAPTSLDPDSDRAVVNVFEREKGKDFSRKHAKEFKDDPVLAMYTQKLIQDANTRNEYLDQESALTEAKEKIAERVNPQVKQASKEGIEEGQKLAKEKLENAAVGTTSVAQPQVSDDDLTSEEYAKKHNISRDTDLK